MVIFFLAGTATLVSQSASKIVEQRALELYEALKSPDEAAWEGFINENFSHEMLEKYEMSRHLEMFRRLHNNFSASSIKSIQVKEYKVSMVVLRSSDTHPVTFEISHDKKGDHRINGLSIEAGEL